MNDVKWTPQKMKKSVESLKRGDKITFIFELNKLSDLTELDELVLAQRPDLILSVCSRRDKGDYSEQFSETFAGLKNVKALKLRMEQKQDLHKGVSV